MINGYKIPNGAEHFFSRIFQNCLELIPAKKYIKYFSGTTGINSWKSSAMQEEKLKI